MCGRSVPEGDAHRRCSKRASRERQHSHGDVARRPDFAGRPRQVDPRKNLIGPAASAASDVPPFPDNASGQKPAPLSVREADGTTHTATILTRRSCHKTAGPARVCLREFRSRLANGECATRGTRADRRLWPADRTARASTAWLRFVRRFLKPARCAHRHADRRSCFDLRARPWTRNYYDMPAMVRAIVREASARDSRFSSLVLGIVRSVPFQMR